MHKIGKLFENGLKTTLCFSTSNLPNFYIFWVPNVVKKMQKNNNEEHRLRPAGVSNATFWTATRSHPSELAHRSLSVRIAYAPRA